MEISIGDKQRILEINLNLIKEGKVEDVVVISEDHYNQFITFLTQDERYEDCALLKKNRNHLIC